MSLYEKEWRNHGFENELKNTYDIKKLMVLFVYTKTK